jgi:hypothetical protein
MYRIKLSNNLVADVKVSYKRRMEEVQESPHKKREPDAKPRFQYVPFMCEAYIHIMSTHDIVFNSISLKVQMHSDKKQFCYREVRKACIDRLLKKWAQYSDKFSREDRTLIISELFPVPKRTKKIEKQVDNLQASA